ncbi:MAG TPA: hypothetical protein VLX61_07170 [Anaerolineales bacterium]|nr:hypothetical protein [Anaerolineales bacterium]
MHVQLPFLRAWVILFLLSPCISFAFFRLHQLLIHEPQAKIKQSQPEIEFSQIRPLPSSTLVDQSASHKTDHALVNGNYDTSLSYQRIPAYYDSEPSRLGGQFSGESQVEDWGRDVGGREAFYGKDGDTASRPYAGEQAN